MQKKHVLLFWPLMIVILFISTSQVKAGKEDLIQKFQKDERNSIYQQLSEDDKIQLANIYDQIGDRLGKKNKNSFCEYLKTIKSFIYNKDSQDDISKKSFILGIVFLEDGSYLVNVSYFKFFYGQCKSTINRRFQEIQMFPEKKFEDIQKYFSFIPEILNWEKKWIKQTPRKEVTYFCRNFVSNLKIKNPTDQKIKVLTESLVRRWSEYPLCNGRPPILFGGSYSNLPTAKGYDRHHLISQKLLKKLELNTSKGPAILILHEIHSKTASYGNPRYADIEMKMYENAGGGLKGLQLIFELGEKDLIDAAKKSGYEINNKNSPFRRASLMCKNISHKVSKSKTLTLNLEV